MTKHKTNYTLLTFYKFVDIDNPHSLVEDHRQFCTDIGMKGRIFIGEEGISSTVTGNTGQVKAYKLYLKSISYFSDIPDIDEKACEVDGHKFPKMIVRYRKEIVALGARYSAEEIENAKIKMSVDEFKEVLDAENDNYVIIDMRNNYEYKLGHFKGAIPAGTQNFKQLDKTLEYYKSQFADKEIIMYCTGGIRCEKAAVMLERSGLKGVYQLDGGVVKYVNKYKDGNWLGNLYTFDGRVSCPVDDENRKVIISECHYTGEPAEEYFNCRYAPCNAQIIALKNEYHKHFGFCSRECYENACKDMLVRDENFDDFAYKQLRGKAKRYPELKEEIRVEIENHLRKNLEGVEFNHASPAKDELMYV
jgi:UPF0176 protein